MKVSIKEIKHTLSVIKENEDRFKVHQVTPPTITVFEDPVKNQNTSANDVRKLLNYQVVEMVLKRKYIKGEGPTTDKNDKNAKLLNTETMQFQFHRKIEISGLTPQGERLLNGFTFVRWYIDPLHEVLKEYDKITTITAVIVAAIISFVGGAVMSHILWPSSPPAIYLPSTTLCSTNTSIFTLPPKNK